MGEARDGADDVADVVPGFHVADEGSIELELVGGELVQVSQRGLPGTEVVEGDLDAHDPELHQLALDRGRVLHRHALGQLDHEIAGRQTGVAQGLGDVVHE